MKSKPAVDKELEKYPSEKQSCRICGEWYDSYTPDDKGVCSEKCLNTLEVNHHYDCYY